MPNTEDSETKPIDRYLAADWPRMREKGRSYFIWRRLVMPFGVPTAIIGAAWQYHEMNFGASDLLTAHGLSLIYISLFFGIASAYVYGAFEWQKRETNYLKEHPVNSEGETSGDDDQNH